MAQPPKIVFTVPLKCTIMSVFLIHSLLVSCCLEVKWFRVDQVELLVLVAKNNYNVKPKIIIIITSILQQDTSDNEVSHTVCNNDVFTL